MSVSEHVVARIRGLLEDRHVVVWYDPEGAFAELFLSFELDPLVKVDAAGSLLRARRAADEAYLRILDPDELESTAPPLLVYAPWRRGESREERMADAFEPFALAGAAFGDREDQRLQSLARVALPGRVAEVDRLFGEGLPTLAQLDGLTSGARYPLLLQALGTDVPAEVAAALLCRPSRIRSAARTNAGLVAEISRMLCAEFGFESAPGAAADTLGPAFAQWVLLSEFVFDLPRLVPEALDGVPRASEAFRQAIYSLCDRMRLAADLCQEYLTLATEVERQLGLATLAEEHTEFGDRDTFPFEDQAALRRLQDLVLAGDVEAARGLLDRRELSVWRRRSRRDVLWRLARRCLELLDAGAVWELRAVRATAPVGDHVRAYAAEDDGLWRVDRAQRLLEQSAASVLDRDALAPLLDHVRSFYRRWTETAQDAFLAAVSAGGWPPEGVARQATTFVDHVAPALNDGRKVAYFLVDALRLEMGRELATRLRELGSVDVAPATGTVPATTAFGMAALLPGAEVDLRCKADGGELIPTVGGRRVVNPADRLSVLQGRLGDRVADTRLGALLDAGTQELAEQVREADLLVVRSTEIDDLGERMDSRIARQYIGEILGDLVAAAHRLAHLGVERIVVAADHGFILVPEILPGDRVEGPPGEWQMRKRRALLGAAAADAPGVVVLQAEHLGLVGPVTSVAVPRRLGVFGGGGRYFHEGLSSQESLVPVVVLDVESVSVEDDGQLNVEVTYRSSRFTSRIISVRVAFGSLFRPELQVRLQAFAPGGSTPVGEAADCDARDPNTGLICLRQGEPAPVPMVLDEDFRGPVVEIRALDPAVGGRVLARLSLDNAMIE